MPRNSKLILTFKTSCPTFTLQDGGERVADLHRKIFVILALWMFALVVARPAVAITYLSKDEALALAFPQEGVVVEPVEIEITAERGARYEEFMHAGAPVGLREPVYVGRVGGEVVGFAMILTERSRYRPITFLVALDPAGKVSRVDVMIYREPRGGEVTKDRFVAQYAGIEERVRLGREIRPISGATVSGQVMTFGVNKAVFFTRELRAQLEAADMPEVSEAKASSKGDNG